LRRKKFKRRLRTLGFSMALAGAAALGWAAITYVELVRLEAAVVDSCARVETASRIRLELVENLVAGARSTVGEEEAARLGQAGDRVREIVITPETLEDPGAYRAYRRAQDELSSELSSVWNRRPVEAGPREGGAIDDLRPDLERWSSLLDQGFDAMEQRVDTYRATLEAFPGSMIAGILRVGGRSVAAPRAATNLPRASATSPRPER
jgi:LemA protein